MAAQGVRLGKPRPCPLEMCYLQFESMSTNQPTYDVTEFEVYVGILLLSLDSLGAHFARIGLDRVSPELAQTSARICLGWLSQSPRGRQKPDLVIDKMVELLRQCQRLTSLRRLWRGSVPLGACSRSST